MLIAGVGLLAASPAAAPPWGSPQRLSASRPGGSDPVIAFGTDGSALATWSTGASVEQAVRTADPAAPFRPAAWGFAAPPAPVAWDARGRVGARLRRAGRWAFGPTETIRSRDAFSAQLRTGVTVSGRAIVA